MVENYNFATIFRPHIISRIPKFGSVVSLRNPVRSAEALQTPQSSHSHKTPLSSRIYSPAKSLSSLPLDKPPSITTFLRSLPLTPFPPQLCIFRKFASMPSADCSALRIVAESIPMREASGGICCSILLQQSVRFYT